MENQHKKISGYRDLSQEEIDVMNEIKQEAEAVKVLVDKVFDRLDIEYEQASESQKVCLEDILTARQWALTAKEDLQVGFMKLVRAIARPTTF